MCDVVILTSVSLYPLVSSMMVYLGTEALKLNVHNDNANVTDLTSWYLKR